MRNTKSLLNHVLAVLLTAQIVLSSFGEALAQSAQFTKATAPNGSTNYSASFQNQTPLTLKNSPVAAKYQVAGQDVSDRLYSAPNWATFETEFQKEVEKTGATPENSGGRQRNFAEAFLVQHFIFCSAMAVNQLFFVLTSGDKLMFDEWKNSMTSFEFHSSMVAFTITMNRYDATIRSLLMPDPTKLRASFTPPLNF